MIAGMAIAPTSLTRWQKRIAYASLVAVLVWTAFGLYAIWLIVTRNG
jgi:hypothetical protein